MEGGGGGAEVKLRRPDGSLRRRETKGERVSRGGKKGVGGVGGAEM
jgi:hypothetical protein